MTDSDQGATATAPAGVEAFTFGDPTPVLDSRGILDYLECWRNGRYFEPPVDLHGLSRTTRANPYLHSGLTFKRNMLVRTYRPHRLLSREAFAQLALDYTTFGMAYVERRRALSGVAHSLAVPLAQYMRRGVEQGEFFQVRAGKIEHEFVAGEVFQLREADADQEVYGLPEWMPAVQSALLNESATLFRRKYYNNGSHAGFILYLTDSQPEGGDVDNLREALRQSRGPGNFRNLFVHSPGGSKDGLKLIPVSEVAAKDEFTGIKSVTRDDMLASLRTPPQLLGIVPQNSGGFGSIREAAMVWAAMELAPLQTRMTAINEWLGQEVIRFDPFELGAAA
ncbi:phage portal protein [Stenotrophomonas maltophilia]|uniref:phage portal protein n=1 Tax=Stenotrophomonas maltophilia TaxID=40324 RepID=UPI0015DEF60D|nr:phage portal protein [Stenotrophomonas maltophilia]MBA0371141.1 phage portal protein [Stenotrophomonas maltophilia]MBH1558472.1 phage portal protein [Stenotrophomonas maltophilia]